MAPNKRDTGQRCREHEVGEEQGGIGVADVDDASHRSDPDHCEFPVDADGCAAPVERQH